MFFRRKPRVTPEQFGADLCDDFVIGALQGASGRGDETAQLARQLEIDEGVFRQEEFYLQVFLMEFVTQMTLRDVPTRKAVLDAFYDRLRERKGAEGVREQLAVRFDDYLAAVKNPHPELGRGWSIGKAFAKLCKAEDDAAVIMVGSRFYEATLNLAEFIREQKLT